MVCIYVLYCPPECVSDLRQAGHLVRDCPTRDETGDTGGRKPPQGYVCRACGSELHLIKDCPVAAQGPKENHKSKGPPREIARKLFVFLRVSEFSVQCADSR